MANGQMGTLCFESHKFFFPNSFSNPSVCGFSFPYKPLYCPALNKRFQVFSVRTTSVRGVNAVQSGEIETCSATREFIDREFKFNPIFNEYVKILESVQTDRSKQLSINVDGSRPKRSSSRKDVSGKTTSRGNVESGEKGSSGEVEASGHEKREVNEENYLGEKRFGYTGKEKDSNDARVQGKKKEFGDSRASGSGWGLVEELLEKGGARSSVYQNRGKPRLKASDRVLQNKKENSVNAVRDTTNYGNLKNRELSDFGNNSKRQEGQSKKGNVVRNVDDVVVNNVMRKYVASKSSSDRTTSLRNVETKQYASEYSNPGIKRGRFIRNNAGKISGEHEIGKSLLQLGNGEAHMLDMDSDGKEQKIHADNAERTFYHHGTSLSKENWYNSSKEVHEKIRSQGDFRFQRDDSKTMKYSSKSLQTHGRIGKNDMRSKARDLDDVDLEDRAAFKTFEVFTDVRNRPRVLRMELEERIQKLAKWLNATDVHLPEWQFSRMMHTAKITFSDHSILRVVQILGTFGNWKRVLQVVEWLQSRERFKSYKSRYIYTTVLDVLGKAKRPVEALNLFYVMREELSSYPDQAAYHCIAVTLGQVGLMKELFDVIDCMRAAPKKKFKLGPLQKWDPRLEPDLVVYNAVLNACVQQKQWEGAFWVLQQLKQQGIKPSSTTYGLVMEVMLACGKYNLVYEIFNKVQRSSIPSPLNYKVLVNTLWREGKADEAVSAVRDMEARGVVGYAGLYYDLARCLCSAGRCEEALLQIDKICKVAKKPLVVTYTGLIQACLNSGSIQNGAYIFNQMHNFCSPNIVTCNIMLKSYLEHGMFEEAKDLFQKILDGTHDIRYKSDLRGKVVPDKFTFNTIMEACVATNNWDAFENAYLQMLHHGYHFDTKRHLRLIMDASRAGKGQLLDTTWEHLVRAGRVPPPPIIKERFCMKLQEDECTAAISCLGIHERAELNAFSEGSWLNLLKVNAHRFKKDTILTLADEVSIIVAEGNKPYPMFENLLNASRKFVASIVGLRKKFSDEHRVISCDTQVKI